MLEAAKQKETLEGDLSGAIKQYQAIVDKYSKADRAATAQALVHMAEDYQKLGDAQATKIYERVVREFSDQPLAVAEARKHLPTPGMPPSGTLMERPILTSDHSLVWAYISPDGRFLANGDDATDGPAIREIATGQVKHLVDTSRGNTEIHETALTQDERQIAYKWVSVSGRREELRVISNESGAKPRTLIASNADLISLRPWGWSSDSRSILTELKRADQTWQFAWVSADNGRTQILASVEWRRPNDYGHDRASLSPDRRYLAYSALATNPSRPALTSTDSRDKHIWILATDGSRQTELTKTAGISESPVWTADGSHVLFLSDRSGTFDLWAIAVQDGKPAGSASVVKSGIGRVSPIGMTNAGGYFYAAGSPEVPLISFEKIGAEIPKATGALELPNDLVGQSLAWSPDGKRLAFIGPSPGAGNERDLVVRSLETGQETRFPSREDAEIDASIQPIWLHDSTALLQVVVHASNRELMTTQLDTSFYRADLKSGGFTELAGFGRFRGRWLPVISPDDRTIYMNGPRPGHIVACDLDTGQQRDVYSAPESNRLAGLALSPDGRTLAFFTILTNGTVFYLNQPIVRLARVGVDGTGYRELYGPFIWGGGVLNWSKDGNAILFAPAESGADPHDGPILRIGAEGGAPERTGLQIKGLTSFDLSPDGSRIVLSKISKGYDQLQLRALENVLGVLKGVK